MKTIAESWLKFSGFIFPKKPTQTRFNESRKSFHAGALTVFRAIQDCEGDVSKLKPLFEEAEKVCKEEIKVNGFHSPK